MSPGQRPRSSREGRPVLPTAEEIRAMQERIDAQAKEVLGHMYQAMLATPEFTLADGTNCKVDPFYAPEVNAGGDLKCAFDVRLSDGRQLEFTVGYTGHGMSLAAALANKPSKPGRSR